ncbi:MAG TPA: hypothetical protein VMJ10_27455 [Kofleriaceae bacterium]|nr:hypothetical protein [Kofleriaceae bacterium]
MRWVVLWLAACGHVGFDGTARGSADAGGLSVVQMQSMLVTDSSTTQIPLTPTLAGDLLVVMTNNITDTTPLMTVSDDAGDAFVSVSVTFTHDLASCGEVWYVTNGNGGAATLTIDDAASVEREVWILELGGGSAFDAVSATSNEPENGMADAPPVSPRRVPAAIVSSALLPGMAGSPGPVFSALPVLHGDDAAFAIVTAPGTYAPVWMDDESGNFGAATVAFD